MPIAALVTLGASYAFPVAGLLAAVCGVALVGGVVAAVHHAEVVAQRIGEPFGTLALAVTAIETSLVISLILGGGEHADVLVRDTVYATVMIIATGVIGLCILLGSIRHREQKFRIEGAGPAFAALAALAVLVLIMPAFAVSAPGATYTTSQLVFVAVCSLSLWCVFVFFQTISHRDYFLPLGPLAGAAEHALGLTVPVVVAVCIAFDLPIVLGVDAKDIALLTLTLLVGAVGIGSGRTNLMYGAVQIVIFAAFLFLALVP